MKMDMDACERDEGERGEGEKIEIEVKRWYPPELIPKTASIQKKRMLSVPSRVLAEAGVDVSRTLYGRWVVDSDNIRLEVSYEKAPGFHKLTRMNPSPCRLVYLPSKLRLALRGFRRIFWFAEDRNILRFIPAKNTVTISRFLGAGVKRGDKLLLPYLFSASRCILGFAEDFILAIPDDTYGVSVSMALKEASRSREAEAKAKAGAEAAAGVEAEMDLKPVLQIIRRKWQSQGRWQCWEGFAEITREQGSIERKCIVLFPEGAQSQ